MLRLSVYQSLKQCEAQQGANDGNYWLQHRPALQFVKTGEGWRSQPPLSCTFELGLAATLGLIRGDQVAGQHNWLATN